MTRWPQRRHSGLVEFPAWFGEFIAADWADPMADRQRSAQGADHAARTRWCVARNEWLRAHPDASAQASAQLEAALASPL